MRVMLLSDRDFAEREHALLSRLSVSLAGDSYEVTNAAPGRTSKDTDEAIVRQIRFADDAWSRWVTPPDLRIARSLERDAEPDAPLDVIHAFGPSACAIGAALAERLECDALLECWNQRDATRIARAAARVRSGRCVLLAPDDRIASALRAHTRVTVSRTTWGVPVPEHPTPAWRDRVGPLAIGVLSAGCTKAELLHALGGLRDATADGPECLVFVDDAALSTDRALWFQVERLGFETPPSLIPDVESRRHLILRAHALVCPARSVAVRSVVLESLAAGLTVYSPLGELPGIQPEGLHEHVAKPTREGWREVFSRTLTDDERAHARGHASREAMREHHPSHRHAESLEELYESLHADGALPFEPAGASR